MKVHKTFEINNFFSLKLEEVIINGKSEKITNIYINGEKFIKCKYLLFIDPQKNTKQWEIDSIDEAQEKLNQSLYSKLEQEDFYIEPEQEFWGHCSNLQAWAENNYDTRLIHTNLAFPLLKELSDVGDPQAKKVFQEEIAKRYLRGSETVRKYLSIEGYLRELSQEQIYSLFDDPIEINAIKQIEHDIGRRVHLTSKEDTYDLSFVLENGVVAEIYMEKLSYDLIPDTVQNLTHLKKITFLGNPQVENQNSKIPDWIGNYKELRRLNLHNIQAKKIPSTIGRLSLLKRLKISGKTSYDIPEEIGELKSLNTLILKDGLRSLPNSIGKLKNLRKLVIEKSSLLHLPDSIGKMDNLIYLSLKANSLINLPESFGDLSNLEYFYLRGSNFKNLPSSFGNLKNLKVLEIESNLIKLPESFGNFQLLENLTIKNGLKNLPEIFGNLRSLKTLKIINTEIESLPESFGSLKNLERIMVKNNELKYIPASIGNMIIKKAINDLAFTPDGEILAGAFESTDANGSIRFWNLTSNEFLYEFDYGYWNEVYSIDFSPDGSLLAVGDGYSTDIWDFNSRELLYILKYENHRNNIYSVDFSPNGKLLASSGWNNTVMIWNVSNGKPMFRLIGHNNSIRSVHFSPDSTKLVSGSEDDTLKIWNVSTGEEIMTLKGHSGDVYSAKFGSRGEIIVSGAWYDSSIIWNSTTGKLLQRLHGCQYGVADLDFSPDGGKIAAGEWCRTARLWDSETGNVIRTLNGEYDNQVGTFVVCVAFSPKNDVLATGHGFDGQSFILF